MKIIGVAFLVSILTLGVYIWKTEFGDDEIYILPDGYRGAVWNLYDQENGEPVKYERGKRLYEIPQDGVLRTQFSLNTGWHRDGEYYYKDSNGKLISIPYVADWRNIEAQRVQVCCITAGSAGKDPRGPSVRYSKFFVGTKEEIRSAGENRERINPIDLLN